MIMLPGGAAGLIGVSKRLQVAATIAVAEPFFDFKGAAPTMRRPRLLLCLLALAGAIATGATAATSADPGDQREDDPRRRHDAALGHRLGVRVRRRGANAYFKYVNSRGGVNGRTITYKTVDDAYDPGKDCAGDAQLVEQDKVFAIFNSLGRSRTSPRATT
jgi:hypothetical protein